MRWHELCDDPRFNDLPYKIELDEHGKIVMSPQKLYHSILQGKIEHLLRQHRITGEVFPECAIHTKKGTKVADVVWVSGERYTRIKDEVECSVSPEICIEIMSGCNTQKEMEEKRLLYFRQGAQECWLCDEAGVLKFFDATGQLDASVLIPEFPPKISI